MEALSIPVVFAFGAPDLCLRRRQNHTAIMVGGSATIIATSPTRASIEGMCAIV